MIIRSLLALGLLLTQCVHADILIFQSSDNHSEYGNIPNYIRTTSARAQEFLAAHPSEPVIHVFNGDLAGPSVFTLLHGSEDRGYLNYDVAAALHQNHFAIVNSGNHEAFDYRGEVANKLFIDQVSRFLDAANASAPKPWAAAPIRLTTANVLAPSASRQLFQPYQDIVSPSGKKIRVVGILLEDFYEYASYDRSAPTQAISMVRRMLEVAKEQLLIASHDGTDSVIFMFHEQFKTVKKVTEELLAWKNEQRLNNIEVPVVFSAHDHEVHHENVAGTDIIDSGSSYEFSETLLDDNGRLKSLKHWTLAEQKQYESFSNLLAEEASALARVNQYLDEVNVRAQEPVLDASGQPITARAFAETRTDLKKGRFELGSLVADTLQEWARSELLHQGLIDLSRRVLVLFNSGSYRNGKPISGGVVTREDTIKPYPLPGDARLTLLRGDLVQSMYTAIRRFGVSKNEYTPQIPSNMREDNSTGEHILELADDQGQWHRLDPAATYAVAMDAWLAINGFRIPEFDAAFAQARDIKTHISSANEIFMRYFAARIAAGPCEAALE